MTRLTKDIQPLDEKLPDVVERLREIRDSKMKMHSLMASLEILYGKTKSALDQLVDAIEKSHLDQDQK